MLVACFRVFIFPKLQEFRLRQWFFWYGTGQEHIITNFFFATVDIAQMNFNQDNTTSPDRGCSNADNLIGCHQPNRVWNARNSRNIEFDNCGGRYCLHDYHAGINAN